MQILIGGRPPDAVDLMFFLCCCLHEYYDWPPSALSLSFAITNTLIIQKPSPVHSYYKPFENHINMLQNVCHYFLSTAKYLPYSAYECGNDIDLRRHLHKLQVLQGPTM